MDKKKMTKNEIFRDKTVYWKPFRAWYKNLGTKERDDLQDLFLEYRYRYNLTGKQAYMKYVNESLIMASEEEYVFPYNEQKLLAGGNPKAFINLFLRWTGHDRDRVHTNKILARTRKYLKNFKPETQSDDNFLEAVNLKELNKKVSSNEDEHSYQWGNLQRRERIYSQIVRVRLKDENQIYYNIKRYMIGLPIAFNNDTLTADVRVRLTQGKGTHNFVDVDNTPYLPVRVQDHLVSILSGIQIGVLTEKPGFNSFEVLETIESNINKPEPLIEPDETPEIVSDVPTLPEKIDASDNIKTLPLINFGIGKLSIKLIIEKHP
jgi:hypothetical protein